MPIELVYYGNETLKSVAEEIKNIDGDLIKLIDSMFNVMGQARGVGLAAPQVDVKKRLIVFDFENFESSINTLINPVIKESSNESVPYEEGCLSVPGITSEIIRPKSILVSGITPEGKEVELEADGLLARVLQHEIDHLNGVLFIDRLEDYLRNELRAELKQIKKMNRQK